MIYWLSVDFSTRSILVQITKCIMTLLEKVEPDIERSERGSAGFKGFVNVSFEPRQSAVAVVRGRARCDSIGQPRRSCARIL